MLREFDKMKQISREKLLQDIENMRRAGNSVDKRLLDRVSASESNFYSLVLEDEESFLSMIWHELDATRLLTPCDKPRTLKHVLQRMIEKSLTFDALAKNLGLPKHQHNPDWFKTCVSIDTQFNYDRFGWITIVPATDHEHKQSPCGTFYIYDGCHKTLVLGKWLLCDEIKFQPINAVLLVPRPD